MQTKSIRTFGSIIYFLGIFLGLGMSLAVVWSAFEGLSYFYTGAGYPSFNGLDCPLLMTRSETAAVNASFNNPGDQEIEPYYEVTISGQASMRKFEGQLSVPAHSSKSIRWTVNAGDIDLGFFVFIAMEVLPVAGYSTRQDTCGIMVLNLTGSTGGQVFYLTLATSLLCIGIGFGLWENSAGMDMGHFINLRRAMKAMGLAVLLAMLTSFMGLWLPGIIFCVMTILLVVIVLRLFVEG
jgi:hypothetical protein